MASNNKPSQPSTPKFTAEMRERQARNKNPKTGAPLGTAYLDQPGSPSSSSKQKVEILAADDSYESSQRRRAAALALCNPELTMMHALSRGDTVAATRYYFTKALCGYEEPPRKAEKMSEKRAGGGRAEREKEKEKEKKSLSNINYKPVIGAYEM